MPKTAFDYRQDVGPKDKKHLKCNNCGNEQEKNYDLSYGEQADCRICHQGQMMSWNWMGWKDNKARKRRLKEGAKKLKKRKRKPVSQKSEPFENFTEGERNIKGLVTVSAPGTEAPWLTPFGAGLVRIYGIRRREGKIEFGIGNEEPPILGWVTQDKFFDEWPD